jgi:hypothetical protein
MFTPLIAAPMLFFGQKPAPPTLLVEGKKISVTIGDKTESFIIDEDPMNEKPVPHVAYRRNDAWAVWDDRGLTIRKGTKAFSTRLGEIAVSPRAFVREDILKNLDLFKSGQRKKESDALSGSIRFGTKCFFVPRWTGKDGESWLEALIMVDLADEAPKPNFVGRFRGLTSAYRPIDEKLFFMKDRIAAITNEKETWGLSTFDSTTSKFEFSPLGSNLLSYYRGGFFLEQTSYGTQIVGQIDLNSGLRKNLFETRSKMISIKDGSPYAVVREKGNTVVKNLRTGGQITHAANAYVTSLDNYVLVWTRDRRTTAWLYDPSNWTQLATAAN